MNHAIIFSSNFCVKSGEMRQGIVFFGRIPRLRERLSPPRLSFHSQFPPNKFLFCSLRREIFFLSKAIENCVGLHARVGQLHSFYDCRSALTVFTASPILERGKRYFFTSNLLRRFVLSFSFAFFSTRRIRRFCLNSGRPLNARTANTANVYFSYHFAFFLPTHILTTITHPQMDSV